MTYSAIVIGGGPAGLQAALSAAKDGNKVLIIERESRLGGILKQCVHDGFGVLRFGEKLSGPEYTERFIDMVSENKGIDVKLLTFVTSLKKDNGVFRVTTTSADGITTYESRNIVLANGCRERTARQVGIHGTRPAGIMTAGAAQHYVNLMGVMPTKRCVILGSGDIGLIMARRLTLEGAEVVGVYEAKSSPGGLTRNIYQCLVDFGIPLHLSKTVTRVFGQQRVEAVEIMSVDGNMNPISGTEERIECDALILSVGLIPENELAESLNIEIDKSTKGPIVDQNMMTSVDGVYSAGNALHVHDLVDYVSDCASIAGTHTLTRTEDSRLLKDISKKGFLYLVPQRLSLNEQREKTVFYFRTVKDYAKGTLRVLLNGDELYKKKYTMLKTPEMERVEIALPAIKNSDNLEFILEGKDD